MSGRYAFVEKGALKDDDVTIKNASYAPTTASPTGKIPTLELAISYFSKLFNRNEHILLMS